MKPKSFLIYSLATLFCIWLGYIISQEPKVWCNRQWAGIALLKGHYRAWHVTYSHGYQMIDGKRKYWHHRPRFMHVDMSKLAVVEMPVLEIVNESTNTITNLTINITVK